MAQNSQPLLLMTLAFFGAILLSGGVSATSTPTPTATTTSGPTGYTVNGIGTWDISNDPHLQELGQYAVIAYNLLHQKQLTFEKVISCDHLPGITKRLTISAGENGVSKTYEALVSVDPWLQFRKLISFRLS